MENRNSAESTEVRHVESENVMRPMNAHRCRQSRVMNLNSDDSVFHN